MNISINKRKILTTFLFVIFFFWLSSIKVSAHESYFLAITIDDASNCYRGEVVTESSKDNHREKNLGDFTEIMGNGKGDKIHKVKTKKELSIPKLDSKMKDVNAEFHIGSTGKSGCMVFTFPAICSGGFFSQKVDASDKDLRLIQRVVDYPLKGLNDAIEFIINKTGWEKNTSSESI